MGRAKPLRERFESKFTRGPADECWPWMGQINAFGHGVLMTDSVRGQKRSRVQAHRLAYEIENGPVPAGLVVTPKCRNLTCVNPGHLIVVTREELVKIQTAVAWATGGNQPNSRLSARDVAEIRERVRAGETEDDIASDFRVTQTCVSKIKLKKSWRYVKLRDVGIDLPSSL